MAHLTKGTFKSYLNLHLAKEMLMEVEEHLAECADCSSKVRKGKLLQFAWNTLTAEAHGQAYWQARLEGSLNEAVSSPDYVSYRERIREWVSCWQNKAEAVLGLVFEAASEKTQILTQGWESLIRPDSKLGFAFSSMPIRGIEKGPITVETSGKFNAKVTADSQKGIVTVLFRKLGVGDKPPLVMLIPESKGKKPLLAEPEQSPGSKQFIAQFSAVPSGKYLLVFEPIKEKGSNG